jgi:hypothetical protein
MLAALAKIIFDLVGLSNQFHDGGLILDHARSFVNAYKYVPPLWGLGRAGDSASPMS